MPLETTNSPAAPQASSPVKTTLGLLPLIALSTALATPAFAQQARAPQEGVTTNSDGDIAIDQVTVEGGGTSTANVSDDSTAIGRLPGRVQDQPQVVNVIPEQVIKQQAATTLDEVLRNVPGVTLVIGEGGGGFNGSNFRIRGFSAQTDLYVDGLRDFGTYTRDSFNMESVQVFKGPSSETFGMGTTGGAVNSQSKTAKLTDFVDVSGAFGTGPLGRGTLDVNRVINETTAFRFNAMVHEQDIADRDHIEGDRWGVAASLGLGLGTDLEYNLSFFHQKDNRVLDYGIPVFAAGTYGTGANTRVLPYGLPSSEFGVARSNFYGIDTDADESRVDMVTGRLKYEANDWLTIYNDTRISSYDRYWTPEAVSCAVACITNYFNGLPATVTRGGPSPTDQDGWAVQNVSTAVAKFETGQFRHEFVAGLDMYTQGNTRYSTAYSPARPSTTLVNPSSVTSSAIARTGAYTDSDADNIGFFASDRLWLTEQLSILGGVRWDWYSVDSRVRTSDATGGVITSSSSDSTLFNPRASLIWEPTPDQTYYVSWARSASPQGLAVSTATGTPSGNDNIDPEENENFEIGGKVNLLEGRLGLSGAFFQTTKGNAIIDDGVNPVVQNGEEQRVRGFELGVSGQVTDNLTITGGYTYLDAEITAAYTSAGVLNPAVIGKVVPYVPEHSLSLWATYDATKLVEDKIGGKLLLGTGINYQSKVWLNNTNVSMVPSNFSWDAMVAYEKENFRLALNVKNITDELNYDQVYSNRVVPSSGRTFLLTAGAKF